MFEKSRKSRSTFGSRESQRYWSFCLMNFWNFFTIHVFEVEESIADIPTRLSYLGDLKKLGQLPVREILRGSDDCVLWNFAISSIYMFSMSGNHLLTFLLCYYVWGTSKIQNNFWFWRLNFWDHPWKVAHVQRVVRDIRTSKLLKHGILVGIPAINSLTSKT